MRTSLDDGGTKPLLSPISADARMFPPFHSSTAKPSYRWKSDGHTRQVVHPRRCYGPKSYTRRLSFPAESSSSTSSYRLTRKRAEADSILSGRLKRECARVDTLSSGRLTRKCVGADTLSTKTSTPATSTRAIAPNLDGATPTTGPTGKSNCKDYKYD